MKYKVLTAFGIASFAASIIPLANASPISYTFTTDITFVTGTLIPLVSTEDKAYITVTLDPDAR
jgi:hypothetical protein